MSSYPAGGPPPPGAPQPPSHPRDYNPSTPDEKAYYDQLFVIADTAATGQLQGLHAVNFFKLSGLDVGILKNVWSIADARQQHYLDREDFYVALRLIAMAQNNIPPTREKLLETVAIQLPYARFQSMPPPATTPPPPPSPPQALLSPSQSGQDPYAMSGEDRARYLNHFAPYDTNGDGFVEGAQAVELFSRSGLDRQALGKVWELSDNDKDSRLNPDEFAVAMHLIVCVSKRGLPVPARLPPSLASLLGIKEGGGVGSPAAPAPLSSPASSSLPPRVQQPLAASASSRSIPSPPVLIGPPSPSLHDTSKSTLAGTLTSSSLAPSPSPTTSTPPQQTNRSSTLPSSLNMSSSSAPSSFKPATFPPPAPLPQTNSSSSSSINDLTGVVKDTQALAQILKAEKISLSATIDSNMADGKRTQAALVTALGEITSLQGELAALRQAAAAADEEQRQALQNLGGARKQREMLLMEVEKVRGEVERLQQQKSDLSEELASLRIQVGVVGAGEEGMEALRKDHVAEAGINRTEIVLLRSLLSAMGKAREERGREVEELEGQVAGAKQALAQVQASVVAKKEEVDKAREERDVTTAERHAALVQLASGELKLPPSNSSSSSNNNGNNSNGKPATLSASSASSPKTTAAAPSSSSIPPSTKPSATFGFDEESDALSAAAPKMIPSSVGTSASSFPASLPSSTAAATSTFSTSTSSQPPHNASPTLSSGTPPPPAPATTATASGGGVKDAFSDGFDDDGFGPSPSSAAAAPPPNLVKSSSSNSNSNGYMENATVGDDYDFPAPEEGGLDDSFPAPEEAFGGVKMSAPSTAAVPAAAAPAVIPASSERKELMGVSVMGGGSGGEAGQAMSDPFASDPFSFPDDNAFGDAPPVTAPAGNGEKGGGFGDGFDSSAFDKF